jgi:uncharacterized membrane protein YbhN (UPF0104 family)
VRSLRVRAASAPTTARWIFVGKVAVSATLLFLLFRNLGLREILDQFRAAEVALLLLASLLPVGQVAVAAWRWQVLLRQQGVPVDFSSLFKIYLMSDFLNLFMPSIVMGDAFRAVRLRRFTQTAAETVPSVVLDRACGLAALIIIGVLGVAAIRLPNRFWSFAVTLLVIVALAYLFVIGPLRRWMARGSANPWLGLRAVVLQLLDGLQPSKALAQVAAISFFFQINVVLIVWLYALILNLEVGFAQLLVAIPATTIVELAPISINGIGVREGTLAFLFAQMGLRAEHGFVLGATISAMKYFSGLVGGVVLTIDTLGSRRALAEPGKDPDADMT